MIKNLSTSLKFLSKKNSSFTYKINFLSLSTKTDVDIYFKSIIPHDKEGHLALVSLSNNIHYNLALENYLAENVDLKNRSILLIWRSDKSVVYGRHQNPWIECNLREAELNSVRLARRYTGGGCVYHDLGNLNISFIVNRLKYDRKFNLNVIKKTLDKLLIKDNCKIELSPRHDIFIKESTSDIENSYKISGTASRLAKNYSYHHCTLLYESNIENMRFLKSDIFKNITTKATPSVRSKCLNLKDIIVQPEFNIDKLIKMLCEEYWRSYSNNWAIKHLFNYVDPHILSGLYEKSLTELESWDFKFATTPKFQLDINMGHLRLELTILKGHINKYAIKDLNDNEITELDDSFEQGLCQLINVKLKKNSLLEIFEKYNLIESHENFNFILNYINKNIS